MSNKKLLLTLSSVLVLAAGVAPAQFVPCDADLYTADGAGQVGLLDIVEFANDYFSGTNPVRSDFVPDGVLNLLDVALFASAVGTTGC
jgi:hypothetical protein